MLTTTTSEDSTMIVDGWSDKRATAGTAALAQTRRAVNITPGRAGSLTATDVRLRRSAPQ
jgi:hypothetical protein